MAYNPNNIQKLDLDKVSAKDMRKLVDCKADSRPNCDGKDSPNPKREK